MRKQLIASGLVLTIAMGMLSGCGKKGNDSNQGAVNNGGKEEVSLRLAGSVSDLELLGQIADSFKKQYESEPNLNITVEELDEAEAKFTVLDNVNEAPDVFTFADDQLTAFAASGVIEPIQYMDEVKGENQESAVEACMIDGKMYAYPLTADNGYFMFYDKKYFSENDVKSLDKMLEVAAKAGKKVTMDWSSGWYLYSFFGNTGLTLALNEDGITNSCNFNTTKGDIKGIDVANAMYDISRSKGFLNTGDDGFIEGIYNGSVIAGMSGTWKTADARKAWGNDYGAVKLPTYTCGGKQVQLASYAGYKMSAVNAYSEHKEWAEKLAKWVTNQENQELRFNERGQGPANIKAAQSEAVGKDAGIQAVLAQSEFASLQRVGGNYWDPMSEFGLSFFNGKITKSNMQKKLDALTKAITAAVIE